MILVTGGTGLVGSHLLYCLAKKEDRIRAIYRDKDRIEAVKKIFGYYTDDFDALIKNIEWVESDLKDIPRLDAIFKGITQVYHCAALISFDPKNAKKLHQTNVLGTANIVNLCIHHKVDKLCYVSSIATIGNPTKNELVDEQTEFNESIANVYALSKYQGEMEVWRGSQEGIQTLIVNPGVILGPGFWSNGSGSLFTKIKKGIRFYPKGKTGFVPVMDVVKAMLGLMNSKHVNERYIVVADNLFYKEAFSTIADSLKTNKPKYVLKDWMLAILWRLDWLKSVLNGSERLLSKKMAQSVNLSTSYDTTKLQTDLNFQFGDLDESIASCAAIFLEENP